MQYNFVLIRTDAGGRYARKILNSVKWLNENKYPQHRFDVYNYTIAEFMQYGFAQIEEMMESEDTIIHARCANPRTEWTIRLRELEEMGYKVVNSVDCIELTSNKLACSLYLQGKVNHPKSWEYRKNLTNFEFVNLISSIADELPNKYLIAKPLTSLEQGANVKKIELPVPLNIGWFKEQLDSVSRK